MVNFLEINESAYVLKVSRFTGYFCGDKFCYLSIVNGTAVYFLKSLDPDQGRRWHRIHDPMVRIRSRIKRMRTRNTIVNARMLPAFHWLLRMFVNLLCVLSECNVRNKYMLKGLGHEIRIVLKWYGLIDLG